MKRPGRLLQSYRSYGTLRSVFILLIVLSAGCAFRVKLVGQYDEITDKAVTDLQKKTATFFAKLESLSGPDASYDANKAFYEDAAGDVAALLARTQIMERGLKKTPLSDNVASLKQQLDDLAIFHKTSPPTEVMRSAEEAMNRSFRAILENLLFLKWNKTPSDSTKQ